MFKRGIGFVIVAALFSQASALDNQATADVAGVASALDDSDVVTISALASLKLEKRAFLTDGTLLSNSASLLVGTRVQFLLYINNSSSTTVADVSIQDVLESGSPGFVYVPGSIKSDATLVSAVTCPSGVCVDTAIYAQVNASGTAAGDSNSDGDIASFDGSATIDIGNASVSSNLQLDVPAQRVLAVLFEVDIQ